MLGPFIKGTFCAAAYMLAVFLALPWVFLLFDVYFPWVKSFGR